MSDQRSSPEDAGVIAWKAAAGEWEDRARCAEARIAELEGELARWHQRFNDLAAIEGMPTVQDALEFFRVGREAVVKLEASEARAAILEGELARERQKFDDVATFVNDWLDQDPVERSRYEEAVTRGIDWINEADKRQEALEASEARLSEALGLIVEARGTHGEPCPEFLTCMFIKRADAFLKAARPQPEKEKA